MTATAGHSFPYDFGFIPGTNAEDNDHVDVLVLMDESAFVGCWVKCRVIGGYKAIQTELRGKVESKRPFPGGRRKIADLQLDPVP